MSLNAQSTFDIFNYFQRQTLVSNRMGLFFAMERKFAVKHQYIARDLTNNCLCSEITEQEIHSYVHQLVLNKQAQWIYQDQQLGFFQAVGVALPAPPLDTPFCLL